MRDPCPYCGIPYIARDFIDPRSRELLRDIQDHDCRAFAAVPQLPVEPTDTGFIRDAFNAPEALESWRRSQRRKGTDGWVTCGICKERVGIDFETWHGHIQECLPPLPEERTV